MPRIKDGPDGALTDAATRRMSNQIARAFRGTFGAATGMETVTTSLARQLLAAGLSADAVARLLANCVLTHPDRPAVDRKRVAGTLVALTDRCVAAAALEAAAAAAAARSG